MYFSTLSALLDFYGSHSGDGVPLLRLGVDDLMVHRGAYLDQPWYICNSSELGSSINIYIHIYMYMNVRKYNDYMQNRRNSVVLRYIYIHIWTSQNATVCFC